MTRTEDNRNIEPERDLGMSWTLAVLHERTSSSYSVCKLSLPPHLVTRGPRDLMFSPQSSKTSPEEWSSCSPSATTLFRLRRAILLRSRRLQQHGLRWRLASRTGNSGPEARSIKQRDKAMRDMEHRVCSRSVGSCSDDKFCHGTYIKKYSETY